MNEITGSAARSTPLIEPQLRNAVEVADVAGEEGQIVMQRGGGNQQIEIGDQLTAATEVTTDACEALHDRIVE